MRNLPLSLLTVAVLLSPTGPAWAARPRAFRASPNAFRPGIPGARALVPVEPAPKPRGALADGLWTPGEFVREAARAHLSSKIHENGMEVKGTQKELRHFLKTALAGRIDDWTALPRPRSDRPGQVTHLGAFLRTLFDGGITRTEVEDAETALAWSRENRNHYAHLRTREPHGLMTEFTVHAPGGENPRLTAFALSLERSRVHFNFASSMRLERALSGDRPVRLTVSLTPTTGEFALILRAELERRTLLLRGQAERAARIALALLRQAGLS